jgi:hypothetical protein
MDFSSTPVLKRRGGNSGIVTTHIEINKALLVYYALILGRI